MNSAGFSVKRYIWSVQKLCWHCFFFSSGQPLSVVQCSSQRCLCDNKQHCYPPVLCQSVLPPELCCCHVVGAEWEDHCSRLKILLILLYLVSFPVLSRLSFCQFKYFFIVVFCNSVTISLIPVFETSKFCPVEVFFIVDFVIHCFTNWCLISPLFLVINYGMRRSEEIMRKTRFQISILKIIMLQVVVQQINVWK